LRPESSADEFAAICGALGVIERGNARLAGLRRRLRNRGDHELLELVNDPSTGMGEAMENSSASTLALPTSGDSELSADFERSDLEQADPHATN
jgi:hypothetical protein